MDRDEVIEAIMVMMESYDDAYLNQILDQITATLH